MSAVKAILFALCSRRLLHHFAGNRRRSFFAKYRLTDSAFIDCRGADVAGNLSARIRIETDGFCFIIMKIFKRGAIVKSKTLNDEDVTLYSIYFSEISK